MLNVTSQMRLDEQKRCISSCYLHQNYLISGLLRKIHIKPLMK